MSPGSSGRAHRGTGVPGLALLAVVAWGASFVVTRVALEVFNPFGLVAARSVAGAAVLLSLLALTGRRVLPEPADRARSVFLGVVLGVHLLIQSYGLQYTSAVNTGWIIGVIPAAIALGAHFVLGQRLHAVGWAGIAVATGGVWIVTLGDAEEFPRGTLGDMLQIVSCGTWTVYTLAAARPVARSGALRVTASAVAVAALLVAAGLPFTGIMRAPLDTGAVLAVAFLGVVCSGVAFFLWYRSLREHGPTRVGATLYAEPFVTLAVAVSFLGEPFTPLTGAGGLLVLAGVWLVGRGSRRVRGGT